MQATPIQDAMRAYALAQVGGPYIMGATARQCTPAYRRTLALRYSDYAEKISAACPRLSGRKNTCNGCKWENRIAHDCAQLSRFAAKAAGIELPSGANSQWTKSVWAMAGEIAQLPADTVCLVFHRDAKNARMSHVGVYLGDGTVADARGHASGVVHSPLFSYPWTHYAVPLEIAREAGLEAALPDRPTLRRGDRGNGVTQAQMLLNRRGAILAEDGVFGSGTEAAVAAFQAANGLPVDGVIGPLTWTKLLSSPDAEDGPTSEETLDAVEEVSEVDALIAEVEQAWERLKRAIQSRAGKPS